jgi:uncharacterized membrane protein YsdA (DUF1294 family)
MNIVGIFMMWTDKQRAQKNRYRISERTLWIIALLGGAIGTTVGMQLYRHKTKKLLFKVGFPLLALAQIILYLYFFVLS